MRGWERAGFDQSDGSANFCSRAARSERRRGASKILPQAAHFFADGSVEEFEVGKHGFRIAKKRAGKKRSAISGQRSAVSVQRAAVSEQRAETAEAARMGHPVRG
jgi:hypothetical protein